MRLRWFMGQRLIACLLERSTTECRCPWAARVAFLPGGGACGPPCPERGAGSRQRGRFETSVPGGSLTSSINWAIARRHKQKHTTEGHAPEGEVLPEDMSPTSLVGGGLIAGESLYALGAGLFGLAAAAIGLMLGKP